MTATLEISEKLYTVEEWLELEKHSEVRHEYYYGKLIAMAGEAKRANIIAGTIRKLLDDPLYEKGYQIFDHDIKAEVVERGIYRYPDLVVAPVVDDEDDYIVKLPVLLAEVSSEQPANRDRVKKRKEYFKVPTLWYYLIASQNEMWVELHLRAADGNWTTQYFTEPEELIELPKFDLKIKLSDIYQRINLQP